jgi:hypothetical protein
MDTLYASASSQPSFRELKSLKEYINQIAPGFHIIIVDMRKENHGFFNDKSVSWYSLPTRNQEYKGEKSDCALRGENRRLESSLLEKNIQINHLVKVSKKPFACTTKEKTLLRKALSEEMIATELAMGYIRFPIDDHEYPDEETLKKMVHFFKNLPPRTWVHIHCRGGKGRATTAMVIHDIIKNAPFVSFEDIVTRQGLIGTRNLLKGKTPSSQKRLEIMRRIYNQHK